ncbi:MAG: phosphatidylglycerol lysyltransferase domain-containing protein [Deltaproteobacteria bacterium]
MNDFAPIELGDQAIFKRMLSEDPPRISELTFTNLFMWRCRYHPVWRVWGDCLLIILQPEDAPPFGLPPVGPGNKSDALAFLCRSLGEVSPEIKLARADSDFVNTYVDSGDFEIVEDRDNSDYVYRAEDLINLRGNKYHGKKNHVNRFRKENEYEYLTLDAELAGRFLDLQEEWCALRECELNPGLFQEHIAIHEAVMHHEELGITGGAIVIEGKVEAFAFGELLNPDTAVIHGEKANPEIPGLYAAINQQFCKEAWSHVQYINREQDLGVDGLRKAKLSYHPDHLVDKFTLIHK